MPQCQCNLQVNLWKWQFPNLWVLASRFDFVYFMEVAKLFSNYQRNLLHFLLLFHTILNRIQIMMIRLLLESNFCQRVTLEEFWTKEFINFVQLKTHLDVGWWRCTSGPTYPEQERHLRWGHGGHGEPGHRGQAGSVCWICSGKNSSGLWRFYVRSQ